MSASDEQIGANVQRFRGDISQTWLANAMRERGHKWTQPTVVSVEKGERPLRLTEADDLADILGGHVARLLSNPVEFDLADEFRKISATTEEIDHLSATLFGLQRRLASIAGTDLAREYFTSEDERLYLAHTGVDAAMWGLIRAYNDHLSNRRTIDAVEGEDSRPLLPVEAAYLALVKDATESYRGTGGAAADGAPQDSAE